MIATTTLKNNALHVQLIAALDAPVKTVLLPAFLSRIDPNVTQLVKILLLLSANDSNFRQELENLKMIQEDVAFYKKLRENIINGTQKNVLLPALAPCYGLDYKATAAPNSDHAQMNTAIEKFIFDGVVHPMKIAFNRIVDGELGITESFLSSNKDENYQALYNHRLTYEKCSKDNKDNQVFKNLKAASYQADKLDKQAFIDKKTKRRRWRWISDQLSFGSALLVATGQAAIAACCFVILGVAQPLFVPIFIASLITNLFLFKTDVRDLGRRLIDTFRDNTSFFDDLTGIRLRLAQLSCFFATSAALTFGFIALTTTQFAFISFMPLIGLSVIVTPTISWLVAGIVASGTALVFMPLFLNSMKSYIHQFSLSKIKDYFSFNNSGLSHWKFAQSRSWQILLVLAALTITLFAVIATFGSFTSMVAISLTSFLGIAPYLSHQIAFGIVFICSLIPEILFGFKNILEFFNELPRYAKVIYHLLKQIIQSPLPGYQKIYLALVTVTMLGFLALVGLNAYGNGVTSAKPGGDGIKFIGQIFPFATIFVTWIAIATASINSAAANGNYGLNLLSSTTPPIALITPQLKSIETKNEGMQNTEEASNINSVSLQSDVNHIFP